jgi:O-antigen/teichoic acid export membrane protein
MAAAEAGTIVRAMTAREEEQLDSGSVMRLEAEEVGPPGPDGELEPGPRSGARTLFGSFGATAAIQAIQAITGVLLARILGPTGRGELAAVVLWPTLITVIGSLGLSQSSTYYVARARSKASEGAVIGTTLGLTCVCSIALVAIGSIVVPLVLSGQEDHVVTTARIFLLGFIPLNLLAVISMSLLNGQHRFAWFQGLRVLLVAVTLIAVAVFDLVGDLTLTTGAISYLLAYAVVAGIGLLVILRPAWPDLAVRRKERGELLSFGLRSQLSVGMWNLNERGDQLVISAFFDPTSLGLYVVAVTTTSLTTVIGFSAALVALPIVARISDLAARQRTVRALVGATLGFAILVTIPIFILEPYLIKLFFGEDFSGAAGVGRILLVAAIFFGLNRTLEAVLQAVGRPLESSIGESIALVVTVVGLAILLPTHGIIGAGITSLAAYAASAVFLSMRVTRALDISVGELLVPSRASVVRLLAMIKARR